MKTSQMKRFACHVLVILLGTTAVFSQEGEIVPSAAPALVEGLSAEGLEKRLEAIAADGEMDEAVQKALKESYGAALASLKARDADLADMAA